MGKLVVTEFITLDGVIEDPGGAGGGRGGWAFKFDQGDEGGKFKFEADCKRRAAPRARDVRGLCEGLADDGRHGRVRREDERDAQVRRLEDAGEP